MTWQSLSPAAKCVIERCWMLHSDEPCSFSVKVGDVVYPPHVVTEETVDEVFRYQYAFPYFIVAREGSILRVTGVGPYGSWKQEQKEVRK